MKGRKSLKTSTLFAFLLLLKKKNSANIYGFHPAKY